jgi:hypothetical protein
MKIWIGVVSPNEAIRTLVGTKKASIVPPDLLEPHRFAGRKLTVRTSVFVPGDGAPTPEQLESFVNQQAWDSDAIIILFDDDFLHLLEHVRSSCFCVALVSMQEGANLQNAVHRATARALKGWWQLQLRFLEAKDMKLLSLPLRNFQADELLHLANSVRAAPADLANDLQEGLKALRSRIRPRRRSPRKTLYVVDDAKRFYVFGHERHARPETGGDHRPSCALGARFRFGCRIDDERHFNVSESEGDKTSISGKFKNCHDVENEEKRTTHLNMFASDLYF